MNKIFFHVEDETLSLALLLVPNPTLFLFFVLWRNLLAHKYKESAKPWPIISCEAEGHFVAHAPRKFIPTRSHHVVKFRLLRALNSDLVMIQTLLLFKCKLLCYHANWILVSITTRSPSASLQIKGLATKYTTVKWPIRHQSKLEIEDTWLWPVLFIH